MKKNLLVVILLLFTALSIKAQGTLQFNQVKIISTVLQTVPSGKVWKVTSIYGFEPNTCITGSVMDNCNYGGSNSVNMSVAAFKVNGSVILSECTPKFDWASANCTGTKIAWSSAEQYCGASLGSLGYATKTANPNILPMWLPANTTLQSNGPNTFLSVVEFNLTP